MLKQINNIFSNRISTPEGSYKPFGVLLPLIYIDNELHVLFEVRSHKLNTQPGEICFPGGGIELNETYLEGALRETHEELDIPRDDIEHIGDLDYIVTPFNLILYPYVGILKNIEFKDIKYSTDEVESIFTIPLQKVLDGKFEKYNYDTVINTEGNFPFDKIPDGKDYNFRSGKYPVYFFYHEDKVVWGMTARILNNFAEIYNAHLKWKNKANLWYIYHKLSLNSQVNWHLLGCVSKYEYSIIQEVFNIVIPQYLYVKHKR